MSTEIELIRVQGAGTSLDRVCIDRKVGEILMTIGTGSSYYTFAILPTEAVTIGERLVAAGKAER